MAELPEDYIGFQWRKLMGQSYDQYLATPFKVVMRDLSFQQVEVKVEKHLTKKTQNA